MYNTSKPKHTMADKSRMKAFQRFTQIEMKEHDHGEEYFFYKKKQATWIHAGNYICCGFDMRKL